MSHLSAEKTQEPTPYRRQLVRREGRFPRSNELVGTVVIGGFVLCLPFFFQHVWQSTGGVLGEAIASSHAVSGEVDVAALTRPIALSVLPLFCMLALGVVSLAVIANVLQRSAGWKPERLKPDLTRLNLVGRFTSIFSTQKWSAGLIALGRFALTLPVVVWWLWLRREDIAGLSLLEPQQLANAFMLIGRQALLVAIGCVALWAAADYLLQWWSLERSIRMTPDEIREEARKRDGDLQIRTQRRSRHAHLVGRGIEPVGLEQEV